MKSEGAFVLPLDEGSQMRSPKRSWRRFHFHIIPILALLFFWVTFSRTDLNGFLNHLPGGLQRGLHHHVDFKAGCAQPEPLTPSKDEALDTAYEHLTSSDFRTAAVKHLSGAVQVKTESFDDLGEVGQDARWEVFYDFHKYLAETFPRLHKELQVEKVNTHGLLFTWQGSDASLKPTLLMAHQDTVPVPPETIEAWTHPPWSGHYDGTHIWGRGSNDCKNQLIALLETLDTLLDAGFQPKRTILLSFGFDEEISGFHGAAKLSTFIEERYGKDGIAVIVDEGSAFEEAWGTLFAKPGTAEKGYTDVHITVRKPGGHSSVPTDHTGIGILSELITEIESEQYPTRLTYANPYYTQLQCGAAYSPEFPDKLKHLLAHRQQQLQDLGHTCSNPRRDNLALEAARLGGPPIKYLMQTSQAADVINGGIKVNALPERVTVVINHRINIGETTQIVKDRLTTLAADIAKKYDLALHAFDGKTHEPSSIILEQPEGLHLEVAPITPSDTKTETPYSILAGTTRAVYGKDVVVTPGIMTGNTDTRHYWGLTRHIFRFSPAYDPENDEALNHIHTVDERVSVTAHVNMVRWFVAFVRNLDEAEI
ncbi:hypothetical protein B0J18DRAFT_70910 [Chaetomium sp. MPI-SDFR-AT-0129]|nr:hypothetical protein B0J18DRAFT_70910 [Chaetomium sp. MPI-SDFR-AT-0129]